MRRRDFLAQSASVPALLGLAACGANTAPSAATDPPASTPASTPGEVVTIKFDSYNYGTPGLGGKGTQQLIDEFQALNPNIKVLPHMIGSGGNVAAILNSVVSEVAASDPPDVAQLVLNTLDFVVHNLPVQPIDQIAPKDEYAALVKHILPQALKLGQANGHQYGGPYTFSTPTLFYNADLFRAAGLDPDKPPATWDEVRIAGQQIRDKTGKAPLNLAGPTGGDWIVQSLINSNGGTTLSPDKSSATFNQPPAIEVFNWWQGLVNEDVHPKLSDADAQAGMLNGTLAMYLSSTVLLPAISQAAQGKYELRTAGEPSFGSKPVAPVNSGSALFVLARDPAKQQAAWKFLQFAASQRGNTIITSVIGYVPQRDDVVDDPNYLKPFLDKDPRMLPTIKQLSNLQTWVSWPGKNANQALDVFTQAILNVVYAGQEAQPTMDAAAARVDALLKDA
jgi:multiple sugar transport system substrate-binding protein